MKKWNNPELLNLELQETKEHTCYKNKGDNISGHSVCNLAHEGLTEMHDNIQRDANGNVISCCSTIVSDPS